MNQESTRSFLAVFSIFLITLSVYFLLSPGRIDMTDTLVRMEGTRGVLATGFPIIDPFLSKTTGVNKTSLGENIYASAYGVSPHLIYAPLLKIIQAFNNSLDFEQFWFSHVNHLFASLTIVILFLFYTNMGLKVKEAVFWSLICAFFTQFFVTATSSFYQSFQGFFLLLSAFLAFKSGRHQSWIYAFGAGASFFILLNIKPSYIVFFPALILLLANTDTNKIKITKNTIYLVLLFSFMCLLAFLFWDFYRSFYVPSLATTTSSESATPVLEGATKSVKQSIEFHGVLTGLFVLILSPGKGILFYSPIFFVALFGFRYVFSENKLLALASAYIAIIWILGIAQTSIPSGDWCWGPRYLVPIAPVIFLFVPYGYRKLFQNKPHSGRMLLGYCLIVQLLGLSMDFHQYFYRNGLTAFFWKDPGFYTTHSQLIERPIDILEGIKHAKTIDLSGPFRPGPFPDSLTYAIFGVYHPDPEMMRLWMKQYPVFWLPRPWPIWMQFLDKERLPINLYLTIFFGLLILFIGIAMLYIALFKARDNSSDENEYQLSQ